jgi:DNA-binding response OmpR family regulator
MAEEKKQTVMIVEDDPALVAAYDVKFAQEGYALLIATDGKQAMDAMQEVMGHIHALMQPK